MSGRNSHEHAIESLDSDRMVTSDCSHDHIHSSHSSSDSCAGNRCEGDLCGSPTHCQGETVIISRGHSCADENCSTCPSKSMIGHHEHSHHEYESVCDDDKDEKACCGRDRCCDKNASVFDHDHDHNHSFVSVNHRDDDEDCSCCHHEEDSNDHSVMKNCCGDHPSTSSSHSKLSRTMPTKPCEDESCDCHMPPSQIAPQVQEGEEVIDIIIDIKTPRVCNACDPASDIPHGQKVSRLRVANLCCSGEERIIRSTLEGLNGIENVAVNLIGRSITVKHCPEACCMPVMIIIEKLNEKHLGASLQDVNDGLDEEIEPASRMFMLFLIFLISVFIAGVILQIFPNLSLPSMIIFVVGTGFGILPVLQGAWRSLVRRTVDIHILMLLAIIGAVISEEYFDSCLLVTLFIASQVMEAFVMAYVRKAVKISVVGMPKTATLSHGPTIDVRKLTVNDVIVASAGDMICADGEVVQGEAVVNESAMTGESQPISKSLGAKVFNGTIVQNGFLEIRVTAAFADSTVHRLRQTLDDLQADRGQYGQLVDTFAYYWTPGVLLSAFLLVIVGGGVTGDWNGFVQKGLVLLVLACPCAIVISAPIPSMCAIALASKHGVLIKGSSIIEKLADITTLATDKTGTLTRGICRVSGRMSFSNDCESTYDPLELAAAVEAKSTHPLAQAVISEFCKCIAEMENDFLSTQKIKVLEGVGVSGLVESNGNWYQVIVGNERLLSTNGGTIKLSSSQREAYEQFVLMNPGASIVLISVDGFVDRALAIRDELRSESRAFVQRVRSLGISVDMLTGDLPSVAQQVCAELDLDPLSHCQARLLPNDKMNWIETHQSQREVVMMVGDGINDSLALAKADVGVALGEGGAAMTVQAGDLVIMSDNLLRIPSSIELCRKTRMIIIQNCAVSILVKLVAVVLAILGWLSLWEAVLFDLGTLLVIIINGMRPINFHYFESKL